MASSLLALLDDITTVLDDVAALSKVAAQKTAGVLGDDLALNAQQVAGVRAERELPVVWAVFLGSLRNKAILVPLALLISAFAPWAVTPLLMIGGAYLCFEGFEKVAHRFLHSKDDDTAHEREIADALIQPDTDLLALERDKVKGAIRTDFILSAEIIAITLGTVATAGLTTQLAVLTGVALLMTVGVYGFVALIVKIDDFGLYLLQKGEQGARAAIGRVLLRGAPYLMRALSVAGTVAMFLVGGGIIVHGFPALHHAIEGVVAGSGAFAQWMLPLLADLLTGALVGACVLAAVTVVQRLRGASPVRSSHSGK